MCANQKQYYVDKEEKFRKNGFIIYEVIACI